MTDVIAKVTIMQDHAEVVTSSATKILTLPALSELVACLNPEAPTESSGTIVPIILPRNTLLFGRSEASIRILTYHPGHMTELKHRDRDRPFSVPLPNIIVKYNLVVHPDKLEVEHVSHLATEHSAAVIAQRGFVNRFRRDGVWYLPMPNIFDSGAPCYGHNVMPREAPTNNLSGLNWYYDYLEAAPNNNDLYIPEIDEDQCSRRAYDYLEYLENGGFTSYPYELLKR